jgi:hypothetical protein
MFSCRRFTTSRREVQTMASHLQATAGSISRPQHKTLPTAHVYSAVDEFAESVVTGLNATASNSIPLPKGRGMLASTQSSGSTLHALVREEQRQQQQQQQQQEQQQQQQETYQQKQKQHHQQQQFHQLPSALHDDSPRPSAARHPPAACSSSSATEAATERAHSWYGQRSWTRVAGSGAPPAAPPTASAAVGIFPTADDAAPPPSAALPFAPSSSPAQAQAWRFSVMCYNILADTYVGRRGFISLVASALSLCGWRGLCGSRPCFYGQASDEADGRGGQRLQYVHPWPWWPSLGPGPCQTMATATSSSTTSPMATSMGACETAGGVRCRRHCPDFCKPPHAPYLCQPPAPAISLACGTITWSPTYPPAVSLLSRDSLPPINTDVTDLGFIFLWWFPAFVLYVILFCTLSYLLRPRRSPSPMLSRGSR